MDIELPEDMLFQILIRLPVLSLLRFRCVCKSWYSIITTSSFILSHLNHNHNHINSNHKNHVAVVDHNVLFVTYIKDSLHGTYTLREDNLEFTEIETLDFRTKELTIIGCVNGLVCLWNDYTSRISNTLMFWNPCIRKSLVIPDFLEESIDRRTSRRFDRSRNASVCTEKCFGFGYDALSNDYKVIRVIYYLSDTWVYVFSLSRKSWKAFNWDSPKDFSSHNRSCNVGNSVYQLSSENFELEVVSFDLNAEVFTVIKCPAYVNQNKCCESELMIFRDSLALVHEFEHKRYHISVLTQAKSWMKMFSVDLDMRRVVYKHIVGFTKKGVMVVVREGGNLFGELVDVEENGLVVIYVPRGTQSNWHMEPYKESLVLLLEGDSLPPFCSPKFGNVN